jgi:glycosyltransferase involved in cell wall biosynthesis
MPLRFLFVTEDKYPPLRPDVAVLFAEELVSRGHQIDWLLQAENSRNAPRYVQWSGGRAWVAKTDTGISRVSRLRKNLYDMRNDLNMFILVRNNCYDFIQVKDKFFSPLLAILIARIYKVRFFYWLSFPFPEAMLYRFKEGISRYPFVDYIRGHLFKFLLYRVIMRYATHVFVQSDQMIDDVVNMGVSKGKLTPVPMGVSLNRIPYTAADEHHETHEKIVVYLGALDKVRRMDFLVRVFHDVLRRVPDAKLYMIGSSVDPGHAEDLRSLAVELGMEDAVVFTGFVPMEEGWRYVARAAVAVSPFYPIPILRSTSPTKLVEYMAMGKPVVANDHPEQRKVIAESGGGICVAYDEAAFADAVVELLSNPDKASIMGRRGRRYVEEYRSYAVLADQVEQRYLELCQGIPEMLDSN